MSLTVENESLLEFFKKIEPITKFFSKIDDSPISGAIFAIILLIFVLCSWYWICFKGGDKKWKDSIVRFNKKLGVNYENSILIAPATLKIFMSLVLLVSIFFLFIALMDL